MVRRGLKVFAGAAKADELSRDTEASRALAAALRAAPLTILALGPVDQRGHGACRSIRSSRPAITRVIAVAGRRPGQRFTTGSTNTAGHRDFNFELDPRGISGPARCQGRDRARAVRDFIEDLDRGSRSRSAGRVALCRRRGRWSRRHVRGDRCGQRLFGVDGFNPFDTLAVAYAISPDGFACETLNARIETSGRRRNRSRRAGDEGRSEAVPAGVELVDRRGGSRHLLRDGARRLQAGSAGAVDAMIRSILVALSLLAASGVRAQTLALCPSCPLCRIGLPPASIMPTRGTRMSCATSFASRASITRRC